MATIGPACSDKAVLSRLIKAGVNVFRLNFSHAVYETLEQVIRDVRDLNQQLGTHTALLGDLQGPKIRIGEIQNNGITLRKGDKILFTTVPCMGNAQRIYLNYKEFPLDVEEGDLVLLDDGKIKLEVLRSNRLDEVELVTVHGGLLTSKKGVNLPNTKVSLPSLTEKDLRDLVFILDHDLDWVALSFVRSPNDVRELRKRIQERGKDTHIISKIEKPAAVDEIDAIIAESDGVMVARGDLGVEYPLEKLPLIQKLIVKKCLHQCKPVIIATQMMESMITQFMPTRAEANDVANAVLDGADALMLSGETSVGQHPVQVIEYMCRIIETVEQGQRESTTANVPNRPMGNDPFRIPFAIWRVERPNMFRPKALWVSRVRATRPIRWPVTAPNVRCSFLPRSPIINAHQLALGVRAFL